MQNELPCPLSTNPREKAVLASERAQLVMEYQQRKREAIANKQRGVAQWMGAGYSPRPLPQKPGKAKENPGATSCSENNPPAC